MQSPARRLFGRLFGLVAAALAAVAVVLSAQNGYYHLSTQAVAGEVVAVQPVPGTDGRPQPSSWLVTVEYVDSNGQYRRFDQVTSGEQAPKKGDDERVWYPTSRPADARLADVMQLWWGAVLFAAGALVCGICAEELLRGPRRADPNRIGSAQTGRGVQ